MPNASTLLDLLNAPAKPAQLSKSAVIIVDAQREYLDGNVPLSGIEDALVEIKKLLAKARGLNVPIFHIVHQTMPGAPIFDPEGEGSKIIDAVKPEGDERIIKKNLPSSFVNTDLDRFIKDTGCEEVVIAGFMTHMCINATTRSAVDLGYKPTIISSACATRDLPSPGGKVVSAATVHESNLASLADLLACVCKSTDDLG